MAPASADKVMRFSTMEGGAASKIIMPILTRAYGQLGIKVEFKFYPASRAALKSSSGLYDGETFRGMDFITEKNDLLPVTVVLAEVNWWAYSKYVDFKVDGYKSLAPYSVSSRRGILAADNILQHVRQKLMVNTFKQALLTLEAGRVDLAIIPEKVALSILKDNPMDIQLLQPAVRVDKLYHFLHKKHKKLIPKISAVLRKMEKAGEIK